MTENIPDQRTNRNRTLGSTLIWMVLILLLSFGLRMWGLADQNIWWDEGLAAWAARLSVEDIIHWTAHDVHPPLYFLVLHGWWGIVGDGEYLLRYPSVLVGVVWVALAFGLGRELGGRLAGILTALLLSISLFAILWSQEMRMYIWASALTTGVLWAALRLWRGPSWRAWVAYVLSCAAALWSLFLTLSAPAIANLAFLWVWWRQGRPRPLLVRWLTAQAATLALVIPWLVHALPRMPTWSTAEPLSPGFFIHLYATMLAVGMPVDIQRFTGVTGAAFFVLGLALVPLLRSVRVREQSGGIMMLALGLLLPPLVVYAVSLPIHLYYSPRLAPRYLLPLAVCYYGLAGLGLAVVSRQRRWAAAVGTVVLAVAATMGLAAFFPGQMRRDELISVTALIQAHEHPDDTVLLYTDKDWPLFAAQYPGGWRSVPYGRNWDAAAAADLITPIWQDADAIWLITTPDAMRVDPQGTVTTWLESNAVAANRWEFGSTQLALYARTTERAEALYDLAPGNAQETGREGVTGWVPVHRYPTGETLHLALYWDRPPGQEVVVTLTGPVEHTVTAPAPTAALRGQTRHVVDIYLPADLPSGRYRVAVIAGGEPIDVGGFSLAQQRVGIELEAADISILLDLRLGPSIRLLGYDLPETAVQAGDWLDLTLYWQTAEVLTDRYKVFTHLLGQTINPATGNLIWGQLDREPMGGAAPTTSWSPNAVIQDRYLIPAALDAPAGTYTLEIGLYDLDDGMRLPVYDGDQTALGDAIILSQIELLPGP